MITRELRDVYLKSIRNKTQRGMWLLTAHTLGVLRNEVQPSVFTPDPCFLNGSTVWRYVPKTIGILNIQPHELSLPIPRGTELVSSTTESQNHRTAWVGRGLKNHLVSTPWHGQGYHPIDQVAQEYHFKYLVQGIAVGRLVSQHCSLQGSSRFMSSEDVFPSLWAINLLPTLQRYKQQYLLGNT